MWPYDNNDDAMFHGNPMRGFGWKPQLADHRDYQFSELIPSALAVPPKVSLRDQVSWRWDQRDTNSCTAFSTSSAVKHTLMKDRKQEYSPSQLFIYYNTRSLENDVNRDEGAEIRDTFKSLGLYGSAPASDWPFEKQNLFRHPPQQAYTDAKKELFTQYAALDQTELQLKQCLAFGYTFVTGIVVFKSMVNSIMGHVPMPGKDEKPLGGHAVCCIGYDDASRTFEFLNSWGPNWGETGIFYMPYDFILSADYTNDFWMVTGK